MEAPPSPDYITGPEYLEYLPPADDVLPAEEQPLPAAVSPTTESPGYITELEPEMEPEEENGDDEKSEDGFIEYPTSEGDDDGDDLLGDDVDDEEEEESSDSEEEEEEHLALTVPASALYSFVSASEETEPFEEGEIAATPPPFGYRVATRISIQPYILMPFRSESEVKRLLAIPTPPLSPVSPTSYPLPPFLMPLPIFTPLPTSSFPLPLSLPFTSANGYFGMPMDPLDPYAQLVMKAPPSPDYIPRPEAPPLPDYIPGSEYPKYLPPADDVFPAEEQPLPAAVSPTVESPGYIVDSEPEMNPEKEDGDDKKSEGDSIDYSTNRGDDDADDDGDDMLEDDADDENKEESSDSEEEEEEHLALTTEPFEEGETAATPPPSAYHVTARISVRPHIPMSFPSELEVERLLAIPTPPLSPVEGIPLHRTRASMVLMRSAAPSAFILAPLSRTPPIGTPPLLPIPLPTSSFPLTLLLPSTSCREGIPEADMSL
nr:hypothetical protein [Tanacetum cinerariifolium]